MQEVMVTLCFRLLLLQAGLGLRFRLLLLQAGLGLCFRLLPPRTEAGRGAAARRSADPNKSGYPAVPDNLPAEYLPQC